MGGTAQGARGEELRSHHRAVQRRRGQRREAVVWYGKLGQGLPVLLAPSEQLAEDYGSHLVPSVFLIDEAGRLVKKLVTEQPADKLRRELTDFAERRV